MINSTPRYWSTIFRYGAKKFTFIMTIEKFLPFGCTYKVRCNFVLKNRGMARLVGYRFVTIPYM